MNKHAQDYTGWFLYYLSPNENVGHYRNGNKNVIIDFSFSLRYNIRDSYIISVILEIQDIRVVNTSTSKPCWCEWDFINKYYPRKSVHKCVVHFLCYCTFIYKTQKNMYRRRKRFLSSDVQQPITLEYKLDYFCFPAYTCFLQGNVF